LNIKIVGGSNNTYVRDINGSRIPKKIEENNVSPFSLKDKYGIELFDEEYEKKLKEWSEHEKDWDDFPEETENSTGIDLKLHANMRTDGNYRMTIRFDFEELEFLLEHAKKLKKEKIDKLRNKANEG
tara:strand:+ start:32 stop:412 length:381 start_codon:yes stop_codon:yes gene_type:complete